MSKRRPTSRQRRLIIERARECYEYCRSQMQYSMDPFSVEHIIPYALGGETELENLALACQGCNGCKHLKVQGYDSALGRDVPLFHPRRERWEDHFSARMGSS